ncbi:ABC transporter permease [Candidatus Pelagisphaera phototrophica]|uniref:ABC transporter permease n=1 Tax=Candidatus Pelagisphaera phototrophica TaxID=2684113 RepID=UPI0019E197CE|nr:ABC transporter permease [Candidatus Pelagisphaera phototrophica]QXD33545.1 ABC transporter permease [Candidatus Pelagisphaera phototrophica]
MRLKTLNFGLGEYGMVLALIGLCVLFSVLTLNRQSGEGIAAERELTKVVLDQFPTEGVVLVVGAENTSSATMAENVYASVVSANRENVRMVVGGPRDLRDELDGLVAESGGLAGIVTGGDASKWLVLEQIEQNYPAFESFEIVVPRERLWPDFLKASNLLAIVERIVVIAIIAIGMTMVIITAGIDLSVGSLIALSAVIGATVVKHMGGPEAAGWVVVLGFFAGTISCGLIGMFAGGLVSRFKVAAFIVTLGIMMMARGLAFMTTGGFSIDQVPDSFVWLAQGRLWGIPNTVILLAVVYSTAHLFMSHTRYGRYIYAVGGNAEAARLTGVPVGTVIVLVYTVSGLAAGLGGCLQASLVRAAAPNMANMYELYVIAAVVVGGTSLSGGSGRMFGTLIGAFIIAVIQNGMNLLGIKSYAQMFTLGAVIVLAVLLDKARQNGGFRRLLRGR